MQLALGILVLTFAAAPAKTEAPALIVLEFNHGGDVSADTARAVTAAVTEQVGRIGVFRVISSQDLTSLLGLERQRQLTGCGDSSCLQELGGALGAQYVLSGDVTQVGKALQLTMQTVDAVTVRPLGRTARLVPDVEALYADLRTAVAEATGTPAPRPKAPSPVPAVLAVGGGLLLSAGGLVALTAFNTEAGIQRELARGKDNPAELRTLPSYQDDLTAVGRQKTLALVLSAVGVAGLASGLGVMLFRSDDSRAAVALAPVPGGVVLAGVLP